MRMRNCRSFVSESGRELEPSLSGTVINGIVDVVNVGVHNVQAEIQSYHDETAFNNLLARYLNGDIDALGSVNNAPSGDLVNVPQTLMAVYNARADMQSIYNGLPDSIKEAIGGVENLDSAYNDGSLADALTKFAEDQAAANVPEPILVKMQKESEE